MPEVNNRKRLSRRALLARAGIGAMALAAPGVLFSTHWLSAERHALRLPAWTGKSMRIAFLTDLHVDTEGDVQLCQEAVRQAIGFDPHAILLGGDYLTTSPEKNLVLLARSLQPLAAATCPAYGVLGNHDYAGGSPIQTMDTLERCLVTTLVNDEVEINGVRIIGLDDGLGGHPDFSAFHRDNRPSIVLYHEPDFVDQAPSWASIQLSGHSHGGQVCLPGGFPLMGTFGAERYIAGFFADAKVPLYVSRGIGTRRVSIRTYCRPEVSLLTLSA